MKVPISWLRDFVEITMPIHELAGRLTMAGLEVEQITYIGLPLPETVVGGNPETKITGLAWAEDKLVTAEVLEVMPHPNADRLVLCRLNDGTGELIVLTGAPNLYPYKGQGTLTKPLKVAYAREGSRIYDGHQPGQVLTTLKRAKIRGVDSFSMICSEKELGISEDHEGVIILDDDAPVGIPLVEYMGDAVLDIAITPNIARTANIIGVAREVAVLTGTRLKLHAGFYDFKAEGQSIQGKAAIQITNPELNPRFVVGLIQGITLGPSPYWMQRRLKLAGMRPISNIVDVTNYVMLEVGEPLHAFDYDVLAERAAGKTPTIITRTAHEGERLTTLDNVDRLLDPFTVLVCDTAGSLSIAGVMGGLESGNLRRLSSKRGGAEQATAHDDGEHPAGGRCLELHQHPSYGRIAKATIRGGLPLLARRASGDGRARRAQRHRADAPIGRRCDLPGIGGRIPAARGRPVGGDHHA